MGGNHSNSTPKHHYHDPSHVSPKYHIITFVISMVLTLFAFYAVGSNEFAEMVGIPGLALNLPLAFSIPFIIFLAIVQAGFQLYYWMHLKDKDHGLPALFLYAGIFVAILTVLTLVLLIWWYYPPA